MIRCWNNPSVVLVGIIRSNLWAKIADGNSKKVSMQEAGRTELYDGYVLFRTLDLQAANVTLQIGDRITEIGEGVNVRVQNLYIISLKYEGHYPLQQGPHW